MDDLREFNQNYAIKYETNSGIKSNIERIADNYEPLMHISNADFIADTLKNLDSFVSQRDGVVKLIKWPGIITSSIIAVSIILLSLSDWGINHSLILLLVFIAVLALISIWSIIRACWNILRAIKDIE